MRITAIITVSGMELKIANTAKEWKKRLLKKNPELLAVARIIAARVELCQPVTPENPPTARIIGGFVRDALIGRDSLDIDIEVYGTRPLDLFAALQDLFPQQLRLLGKSYQVLQIKTHDNLRIEINMPRSRWDEDRRCFFASDPYRTPEQAASSREFICNTAQADPITGRIYDYFDARQEFISGKLRVQDPQNFYFNPLCVFRALHFNTRFGMLPTEETLGLMQDVVNRGLLREIHPRRVADELEKVLHLGEPASEALLIMHKAGILQALFPMIYETERHDQENVWKATLQRLDRVQNFLKRSGEISDGYIANAAIYSALLFDPLYQDYTTDLESYGSSAETNVRRKTNEFFFPLQFEHPNLKRNFPKLMSSLILIHRVCADLNNSEGVSDTKIGRQERLRPRSPLSGPRYGEKALLRSKHLLGKLRPLNPVEAFNIYDIITKEQPTHVPTKKLRNIVGLSN